MLFVSRSPPEFAVLDRALEILRADDERSHRRLLIDVGANIGTTAIPALQVHGFERAIAYEPDPANLRVLRANIALNDLDERLEVVAAAVSDAAGTARFGRGAATGRGWRAGAGSLLGGARAWPDTIDVHAVTLDAELASRAIDPADVGLVWLDAQGHEGHIVQGASRLAAASRPLVLASRARKLEKAGGFDLLVELVSRHYAKVVDLRSDEGLRWNADVRSATEVATLLRRRPTTDVLAFGVAL
jgi:FkbM family methyltransferase